MVSPALNQQISDLFNDLRASGLSLGVDDFLALRQALDGGFGSDSAGLKRLCHFLWAKSSQDMELVDQVFDRVISEDVIPKERDLSDKNGEPVTAPAEHQLDKPRQQSKEEPQTRIPSLSLFPSKLAFVPNFEPRYDFSEYLPLSKREMKVGWRLLRRRSFDDSPTVLNVEATVEQVARQGFYYQPIFSSQPRYTANLILLCDYGGSMIPFHRLVNNLVETTYLSGIFDKIEIYYFKNLPGKFLYFDKTCSKHLPIDQFIGSLTKRSQLLIVSDAGAARGHFNLERTEDSADFVYDFLDKTSRLAWINPMPPERWFGTSADLISALLPMFPMDSDGFYSAIRVLKGQTFQSK